MLQAIAFCIGAMGFVPRLATGNSDNAVGRLSRIEDVASTSLYGIHDLSRCIATAGGEFARMNMPFELGIDYGCRQFGNSEQRNKSILVLEHTPRNYLRALSDISGWDIRAHQGDQVKAMRRVRDWLSGQPGALNIRSDKIRIMYATFQEWFFEHEQQNGASLEDILEYPNHHVINSMLSWLNAGQPV